MKIIHFANKESKNSRSAVCGAKLRSMKGKYGRTYIDRITRDIYDIDCVSCLAWFQDWVIGRIANLEQVASQVVSAGGK
jgi:hypothetical protein